MPSNITTESSTRPSNIPAEQKTILVTHTPDGGYGWVVCFSSFMIQALTIGITYSFGVVFVALLKYFNSEESTTAWIGSIQPALLYFTGIIAGPLINRIGWRAMTISGAILSAVGYGTSALAPNIYLLYFTYGVLTGIGNGLMYITSMVIIQHYFKKKRAFATGVSVSGSGIGTFVFGILTHALIERIGWRMMLVVNCAITLVVGVVGGALFRPLPLIPSGSSENEPLMKNDDNLNSESCISTTFCDKDRENNGSTLDQNNDESSNNSEHENNSVQNSDCNLLYQNHITSLNRRCQENKPQINCGCLTVLREVFDVSLFTNPVFSIFCFSVFMWGLGYNVPFTYTPERAIMLGIPAGQASTLISIMGVSNVCSRLILGWIADKCVNIRFFFPGVSLTFIGSLNMMVTLFNSYPLLILYSILFGAFSGSLASVGPVILVDLLGTALTEKSLGQALGVSSIAFLVASPLSGYIIVRSGNINLPFMVMGGATTLGGLVYFLIRCFLPR